MHILKRHTLFLWLTAVLFTAVLAACGGEEAEPTAVPTAEPTEVAAEPTADPTEEPTEAPAEAPTEEPTPTLRPTDEPTPTAEPTEAPPTATPEPSPTATPDAISVEEMGVAFSYPRELGINTVTVEKIPAQLLNTDDLFYLADVPEFIRVTMNTNQGAARMFVRPIRNEEGEFYSSQPADLVQYFQTFETQVNEEAPARVDQQQIEYMPFDNGTGLRAITYQFANPGIQKITNDTLYYFYDGFTSDGRYYVNLAYPIRSDLLDDGGQLAGANLETAQANFDSYASLVLSPLNELQLDEFEPNLALLDEMVMSLTVAEDASTEVSELANEPNCTNDAVFVRDVSIPDASIVNPGYTFEKIWEVQNVGTCTWTPAYTAVFVDGDEMGWTGFVEVESVAPGENFQIPVDLVAPDAPGIYEGRWQMVNEQLEPFGVRVYVTIVVPEEPVPPEESAGTPPGAEEETDG